MFSFVLNSKMTFVTILENIAITDCLQMKSDNIERILNIDLVLRNIVGYLEPRDLKAAVLVSRLTSENEMFPSVNFCFLGPGSLS